MTTRHHNDGLRKICDCPRRVWPKCSHGWHFSFKMSDRKAPDGSVVAGKAYRFSLDKQLGKHIDSKADAEAEADKLRTAIRAGTFGQVAPRNEMTLQQLVATYLERYVDIERAATAQSFRWGLNAICKTAVPQPVGGAAPLGNWRLTDIVTDTIERFREARRAVGTGPVGVNRQLALLRAMWNWALRVGYVETSPFTRGHVAVVKLSEETSRSRRLQAGEEGPLLLACPDHLRGVVECALEAGMRLGEILSLQWQEVVGMTVEKKKVLWEPHAEIVLLAEKTKTKRDRRIPISSRLRAIMELRRFDPAHHPMALDDYVFGNAIGQQVGSVKRAWSGAVLRSHGFKPKYDTSGQLDEASRKAQDEINLHIHDLRRECGSRWLEGGVPLHTIRDWLGHTNISQTSTYLAGTMTTQHDAMKAFEERQRKAKSESESRHRKGRQKEANLQQLATKVEKGPFRGRLGDSTDEEKANKSGHYRHRPVM